MITGGWLRINCEHAQHIVPANDLRDHRELLCWCHPTEEDHDGWDMVVHNSLDRRELYESGRLRMH